ncbi:DUF6265 family protein [Inhella gelatinilytica]|uniref:DUF6265 domain-containing protein n=1 Tax=Inhella gelatinilytica TaxID=2795030 RepID=A0A931ISD3_9BURK|nr:DUF6265 family protein [Inhella gelatinilytica]MBH9551797.1 hypothetical protein [Inhella gelatinilytica]
MKHFSPPGLALILALLLAGPASGQSGPGDDEVARALADLQWLAGCWQREGGEAGSQEQWMPVAGRTLLGMSRTVRNGCTADHEYLQIRPAAGGGLEYWALPARQPAAAFRLVQQTAQSVLFENPQHDFPQRIGYTLARGAGGDRLLAHIEGQRQDQLKRIEFPFRRVRCEAER